MAAIKRMSWFKPPSAWERVQAWRQRRQAMLSDFDNAAALLNAGFNNSRTDLINGKVELAVQAAAKRVQEATQAKIKQLLDKQA